MAAFSYKSALPKVLKALDTGSTKNLRVAANHVRRKMRAKVGDQWAPSKGPRPGEPPANRTNRLRKGIKTAFDPKKHESFVGTTAPHSHLLEFGTVDRFKKSGAASGEQKERPFFIPTFREETDEVIKIMETPYL